MSNYLYLSRTFDNFILSFILSLSLSGSVCVMYVRWVLHVSDWAVRWWIERARDGELIHLKRFLWELDRWYWFNHNAVLMQVVECACDFISISAVLISPFPSSCSVSIVWSPCMHQLYFYDRALLRCAQILVEVYFDGCLRCHAHVDCIASLSQFNYLTLLRRTFPQNHKLLFLFDSNHFIGGTLRWEDTIMESEEEQVVGRTIVL
jgi:hypothetical protein